MTRIPLYRGRAAEVLRRGRQKAIIIGGVPIPADGNTEIVTGSLVGVRDEINGKSELMRTLPGTRFRTSLGEQCRLPERTAIGLEDFEAGLRAAGFVGVDEVLVQTHHRGTKFRVEKIGAVYATTGSKCGISHEFNSFSEPGAPPSGARSPASLKVTDSNASVGGSSQGRRAERALTGPDAELIEHQRARIRALQKARRAGAKPLLEK